MKKRIALSAVVALFGGLLVAAPASAAAVSATATVGPVRVSFTNSVRDAVPAAKFKVTAPATLTGGKLADAATTGDMQVTAAPTTSAEVKINLGGATTMKDTLAGGSTTAAAGAALAADLSQGNPVTGTIELTDATAAAGTYAGTVTLADGGGDTLTIKWSFTTSGTPKTIAVVLAPTSVPSAAAHVDSVATVSVKDANGSATQISTGDTILVTSNDATNIPTPGTTGTSVTAANLYAGSYGVAIQPKNSATAGSYTITATPQGTLPTQGVTAATATLVVAAPSQYGPTSLSVTSPTADVVVTDDTATASLVDLNPATVTTSLTVVGSGATAGTPVGFTVSEAVTGTITVNDTAVSGANVDVWALADSSGKVTLSIDLTSATPADTETIVIESKQNISSTNAAPAKLTLTYTAAAMTLTTIPANAGKAVAAIGAAVPVTVDLTDAYGNGYANYIVTANQAGTPTGGNAVVTGTSVVARTDIKGAATLSVPAPSTTFAGDATLTITITTPSGGNTGKSSAVTVTYSTDGKAASLTLTDTDNGSGTSTSTTDGASTRTIVKVPAAVSVAAVADADSVVGITGATATPTGVPMTVTTDATSGIRLFKAADDPRGLVLSAGKTSITTVAGTTIYAVPTKAGSGTITFTAGGLTKTFTLSADVDSTVKASIIKLSAGTNANGKATYTVTTTDALGNAVAAAVDLVVTGAASLSNGFKTLTVNTSSKGTNVFTLINDGTGAAEVTATIQTASYQAVTAAEATAQVATKSVKSATETVTVAAAAASATDAAIAEQKAAVAALNTAVAALQTTVASLVASMTAQIKVINAALVKIAKKLKVKI